MYQERLGWERPGWFTPDCKPQINEYDYYGAYDNERNISQYEELLTKDYTFDFPLHHDTVSFKLIFLFTVNSSFYLVH